MKKNLNQKLINLVEYYNLINANLLLSDIPLKRNVSQDDVGNSALYLLSDLGSAVTGEILHVDCGYHTVGMVAVDEAIKVSELLSEFDKGQ